MRFTQFGDHHKMKKIIFLFTLICINFSVSAAEQPKDSLNSNKTQEENNKTQESEQQKKYQIIPSFSLGIRRSVDVGVDIKFNDNLIAVGVNVGYGRSSHRDVTDINSLFSLEIAAVTLGLLQIDTLPGIEAKENYWIIEGRGLIFPFQGSFFIGSGLGYEWWSVKTVGYVASDFGFFQPYRFESNFNVQRFVVSPQFGWIGSPIPRNKNFILGTELGATFKISSNSSSVKSDLTSGNINDYNIDERKKKEDDRQKYYANEYFFFWNIIKVGYVL